MKTILRSLSLALVALFVSTTLLAGNGNPQLKKNRLKSAVEQQIQKHIFFPSSKEDVLEGEADVMFQVYPDGDVRVVLINTDNPLIKKFIESQVSKMKVDGNEVVVGELFRYRFSFKKES